MGQSHIDLEMDGAVDDIYAVESYFLGKKVYYDKLESKDKKGLSDCQHNFRFFTLKWTRRFKMSLI